MGSICKRVLSVAGFTSHGTEVWTLDAVKKPLMHIVIIPGNPGAAGYYGTFMEYLYDNFQGQAHVTAISSLGFHEDRGCPLHGPDRTYTLQEQTAHKGAYLRQYCLDMHDLPVIVLGHSIGLYMAMQAVRSLEGYAPGQHTSATAAASTHGGANADASAASSRFVKLVGLMPFIECSRNQSKQEFVRTFAMMPGRMAVLGFVLERLPMAMRRAFVSAVGGRMDAFALATTAALMRADAVRVAFTMAGHEFRDLDSGSGWDDMRYFAGRLAVLAADNDPWWPEEHTARARSLLPSSDIEVGEGQQHAFCIDPALSAAAADSVERWTRQALADRAAGDRPHDGRRHVAARDPAL